MGRKRVVILGTSLAAFGGAEAQIVMLANYLCEEGMDVRVVKMVNVQDERSIEKARVIPLAMGGIFASLRGVVKCFTLLRKSRPDVIIAFNYPGVVLARLMKCCFPGVRLISSFRSGTLPKGLRLSWLRLTRALDSFVVVNSESSKLSVLKGGIASSGQVHIILNGVKIREIVEDSKEDLSELLKVELGVRKGSFLWVAVGRMEREKNYEGLIRAFIQVARRSERDTQLVIVGDGSVKRRIELLVEELGLVDYVILPGFRRSPQRLVGICDAYVLPSLWEGMSNSLIDAMVLAKPVVVSRVGGIRELIGDSSNGFVVSVGDEEGLAEAMVRMQELEPGERSRMGLQSRERVRSICSVEKSMQAWAKLVGNSFN